MRLTPWLRITESKVQPLTKFKAAPHFLFWIIYCKIFFFCTQAICLCGSNSHFFPFSTTQPSMGQLTLPAFCVFSQRYFVRVKHLNAYCSQSTFVLTKWQYILCIVLDFVHFFNSNSWSSFCINTERAFTFLILNDSHSIPFFGIDMALKLSFKSSWMKWKTNGSNNSLYLESYLVVLTLKDTVPT